MGLFKSLIEALKSRTKKFVKLIIRYISPLLVIITVCIVYFLKGSISTGILFMIVVVCLVAAWVLSVLAGVCNVGPEFPIPSKKFVKSGSSGELSIEMERLHELIVYVGEVEDHLEDKGIKIEKE